MGDARWLRIAAWLVRVTVLLAAPVLVGTAPTAGARPVSTTCPDDLVRGIPPRPQWSPEGRQFLLSTAKLSEHDREVRLAAELLSGNMPRFLRRLRPVTLEGRPAGGGRTVEVTICVTPDYVALGSDRDFVRMPMALPTALAIVHQFGFVLPTAKIVDAIYARSFARLTSQPLPASDAMRSNAYYWWHHQQMRQQRLARHIPLGTLIAGHKKDLVLTTRLRRQPRRVAIYGWHRNEHDPIQPLSMGHGIDYADYSHGVRLVSAMAYVDGSPRPIVELLSDPWFAGILSDEGPIPDAGALIPASADGSSARPRRTSTPRGRAHRGIRSSRWKCQLARQRCRLGPTVVGGSHAGA